MGQDNPGQYQMGGSDQDSWVSNLIAAITYWLI
jgi:hypothetical protein